MEHSAFLNINLLSDEAKKELETFIDFLQFKYRKSKDKRISDKKKKHFDTLNLDTTGFKFYRDEANAR